MGQWLGMSYYTELKLTKSASHEDVTAGFRRLGLQWHPDRNPDNPVEARKKFDKICEAYDVLSNRKIPLVSSMAYPLSGSAPSSDLRSIRSERAQRRRRRW